jgi:hypothetical protein
MNFADVAWKLLNGFTTQSVLLAGLQVAAGSIWAPYSDRVVVSFIFMMLTCWCTSARRMKVTKKLKKFEVFSVSLCFNFSLII